jgi:hypothetical protein
MRPDTRDAALLSDMVQFADEVHVLVTRIARTIISRISLHAAPSNVA